MPRCLTCDRIVEGENARCDFCEPQDTAPGVEQPTAAAGVDDPAVAELAPAAALPALSSPDEESSSPATEAVSPPSPAPGSRGWPRWYLAGGLSASAVAAAIAIALLGGGGEADHPPGPVPEQASFVPAIPREAPSPTPGTVKWTDASRSRWVSNHKRSIAFELPAENMASAWMTRVRPVLVVRCLSRTTDVFVFTQLPPVIEPGDDTRTVRLQFDDEGEHTARWNGAADHDALFAPDPVAFAQRLARAKTLRFGFTPHSGPPATIVFDVRGFDARVGAVARTCRWK